MSQNGQISRRGFLRTAGFAAAGMALAACAAPAGAPSAPAAETGGEAAPSQENVEVKFHARIGQQEDALYDMQMPKFMEENPNITVVKESFPGAEFSAKLATMQAGGTLGDVVWSALGGATIQFAWANNVVAPIDDLVASQDVDLSEWYAGCIDAITVEGSLLGLPFKAHPGLAVIYLNATAFEEAGLDLPTADWTVEEQLDLAIELTESDGERTTQFGYFPSATWKGFVTGTRAWGGELINEDGTVCLLNSEEGVAYTNHLYDLFQTHGVAPGPEQMLGLANDMWISGVLSMFQGGTSVAVTEAAIGDSFEWVALPNAIGPAGVGGSDYEVDAYCVTTTARDPDASFEWVKYLCNQESGVQLGLIGGTVGGRPDVYGAEELLVHPYRVVFKDIMDNAMDSRITANWRQQEAQVAIEQLMQPLWAGEAEPTAAFIDEVTAQLQEIMDRPRP
ncbi:MAG: extracellular solute-binding protein [Litorilinea sp.]